MNGAGVGDAAHRSSAGDGGVDDDDDDFDIYETMDDSPMRIVKGLYIGSFLSEQNIAGLKDMSITHVLMVADGMSPSHPEDFEYLQIAIQDQESEDLVQHFKACFAFIDAGIERGGVLVHCMAGISRSATVCIGYLMWKERLGYDAAFRRVHAERPWIMPNAGFRAQLARFESLGWDVTKWDGVRAAAAGGSSAAGVGRAGSAAAFGLPNAQLR